MGFVSLGCPPPSLGKRGFVLIGAGFVLGTRTGLSQGPRVSWRDAPLGRVCGQALVGSGWLHREGCRPPSPHREAWSPQLTLGAPASGCWGPGSWSQAGMKGRGISWGERPPVGGPWRKSWWRDRGFCPLLQPHHAPGGAVLRGQPRSQLPARRAPGGFPKQPAGPGPRHFGASGGQPCTPPACVPGDPQRNW